MSIRILQGDCREVLATLPDASVQCCVTSPPYYGLRDYGVAGQIGLEQTPAEYVEQMVAVFREVRRVLRTDGTVWLNLGDSYAANRTYQVTDNKHVDVGNNRASRVPDGLKPKDLIGIPWRVAFALQDAGWWLRQDNIWAKRNCMPESVRDRTTRAHEYLFMLTKSGTATFWTHRDLPGARTMPAPDYRWLHRATGEECSTDPGDDKTWRRINLWRGNDYFYDAVAIEEEGDIPAGTRAAKGSNVRSETKGVNGRPPEYFEYTGKRNKRSVWWVATQPFPEAHFATFPPDLIEPCILAGTSERGCCANCGAPWVRQVERTPAEVKSSRSDYGNGAGRNDGGRSMLVGATSQTLDWSPSCACNAAAVPCTVLDPFGGAGTTALVADRLGRNAILIELNQQYCDLARNRLTKDAGMFAEVAA